ncbi:MAG: DUF411 domain-containing protein [Phycisphaerae bacterium]|nr:DUF411 domain-containing protein [Gemmatimonadaceae bacterium]
MPDRSRRAAQHNSDLPPADLATSRRGFLGDLARYAGLFVAAPFVSSRLQAQTAARALSNAEKAGALPVAPVTVKVYKDASCGCCKEWVKHMQKAGFVVTAEDSADMAGIKKKLGVPDSLASCHTAVIGDYLVEGHVPADVVQIMLKEKPVARGLAVPGMPMGSPGMEGPVKDKYNVMLFERSGKSRIYASR